MNKNGKSFPTNVCNVSSIHSFGTLEYNAKGNKAVRPWKGFGSGCRDKCCNTEQNRQQRKMAQPDTSSRAADGSRGMLEETVASPRGAEKQPVPSSQW